MLTCCRSFFVKPPIDCRVISDYNSFVRIGVKFAAAFT